MCNRLHKQHKNITRTSSSNSRFETKSTMSDYYEIDFLGVDSPKSGDAITIRYQIGDEVSIHVVDGGFQLTGDKIVEHINAHYGAPNRIDHVVVTHPDQDHCGGLRTVLKEFDIGTLWMIRPWDYTSDLIGRIARFANEENLARRLKEVYPNIAALEEFVRRQIKWNT